MASALTQMDLLTFSAIRYTIAAVAARAAASPGWCGTACTGMWVGQNIRTRLSPVAFRRWFLLGLLILGIYLVARSTV